ncbi:hypothetical protein D3C87_1977640 [compost metagenome]
MMRPAHPVDDRDPEPCIFLELGKFVGINDVFEVTGDQSRVSFDDVFGLGTPSLPASRSVACQ